MFKSENTIKRWLYQAIYNATKLDSEPVWKDENSNWPFCKIGWHKSDKDYGMKGLGGAVVSNCEQCGKEIVHKKMKWHGGGN